MWKRIIFSVMLLIAVCNSCLAQTWAEWWSQKKTQKKYLIQQIGLFQLYLGYVKKGYDIANSGLTLVGDIKNGDFGIHQAYFNSLSIVPPEVKKYRGVAAILDLYATIERACQREIVGLPLKEQLVAEDAQYINLVKDDLLRSASLGLSQLLNILTDGSLQLREDERLRRIDAIYADFQDKLLFVQAFTSGNNLLALSRLKSKANADLFQRLYEK
ncbi:hypothetical protein J2T02_002583 [Chitinophaga terrae (ex Kim and Jung 2007)]|uniref:hypothetical protein n=1 Tax=Chitinophaga terrae (ex Kim and Jung 2007) TaxID=408074 RepID=UPI002780BED6|nr:hypothetical protein [Chitinophaga terrae (ex Kim and Jung 2007)]MDQ0107464.1 hypothetical protein [Chitinophaga terrae (ex Kim and Jung 2007)]